MRLSWARKEATGVGIPGASGRCPDGSVIPSITYMFPKQTQRESSGGGAGEARPSEKGTALVISPSLPPQPAFPISFALLSAKAHLFLKPPPGSLFGFKRQYRAGERVKALELDKAVLRLFTSVVTFPGSNRGKVTLAQQARPWYFCASLLPSWIPGSPGALAGLACPPCAVRVGLRLFHLLSVLCACLQPDWKLQGPRCPSPPPLPPSSPVQSWQEQAFPSSLETEVGIGRRVDAQPGRPEI